MFDKDLIKSYLKSKVNNFKSIDFLVKKVNVFCDKITVEATVYNFSQFHSSFVVIDITDFDNYKKEINQDVWEGHKSFLDRYDFSS